MPFLQNLVLGVVTGIVIARLTSRKRCEIVSSDFNPGLNQVTTTFADGSTAVIDLTQPTPEAPPDSSLMQQV